MVAQPPPPLARPFSEAAPPWDADASSEEVQRSRSHSGVSRGVVATAGAWEDMERRAAALEQQQALAAAGLERRVWELQRYVEEAQDHSSRPHPRQDELPLRDLNSGRNPRRPRPPQVAPPVGKPPVREPPDPSPSPRRRRRSPPQAPAEAEAATDLSEQGALASRLRSMEHVVGDLARRLRAELPPASADEKQQLQLLPQKMMPARAAEERGGARAGKRDERARTASIITRLADGRLLVDLAAAEDENCVWRSLAQPQSEWMEVDLSRLDCLG